MINDVHQDLICFLGFFNLSARMPWLVLGHRFRLRRRSRIVAARASFFSGTWA
jgi:hypothetical protein